MNVEHALSFAALLKRYRRAAGMTQEELAERANYSVSYISMLERGERVPVRATVELLADALAIPPAERPTFLAGARAAGDASPTSPGASRPRSTLLTAPGARAPLFGRAVELALAERFLEGNGPPVLLFEGEPGIGKSRLLAEVALRADEMGWAILAGACQRRDAQMPYAPLPGALERHIAAAASPDTSLRPDLQGCTWLALLLPELAERGLLPAPSWALPPEQERRLMFAAVARYLTNAAGPAGTVLVLDDLQWAGQDALDLLAALVRTPSASSAPPLHIVAGYRDADTPPSSPLAILLADLAREGLATKRTLAPLAAEEAKHLIASLIAGAPGRDSALTEQIVRRAGGLPFFLVSYAQSLSAAAPGAPPLDDVPWDVAQTVRQRVAQLPETARELLSIAAVAGRAIPRMLLVALALRSGYDEGAVADALEQGRHAQLLIEEGDNAYQFAHDLVREVVARDLSAARRTALHQRIAEALEGAPTRPPVELLAYHYAHSPSAEKAVVYLEEAGDHAQDMRAHAAAGAYFIEVEDRLDGLGRVEAAARVCEKLGAALRAGAQYARALEVLERAAETHRAAGDAESLARVAAQIGQVHADRGTGADGIAHLEPELAKAERAGVSASTLAILYDTLAQLHHIRGQYTEQLDTAERAVALARTGRDGRLLAQVEMRRGNALRMLGRMDEACRVLEDAIQTADAAGDLRTLSYALENVSVVYLLRGDFARTSQYVERALTLAERVGDPIVVALMMLRRGLNRYALGEWSGALADYERAEAMMRQVDASWVSAYTALGPGQLYLAEGKGDLATGYLTEAVTLAEQSGDLQALRLAHTALAERDLVEGRPEAARARLTSLRDRHGQQEGLVTYLLPYLAWAYLDLGDVDRANLLIVECVARAAAGYIRLALVDALRVRALLSLRRNETVGAATSLDEALALSRAMPYPYAEAKTLYVYGQLAIHQGDLTRAREWLETALQILRRLGERMYAERIEQALERLPAS
jgi:tetratricopeptide (TPR) repeat protein/transcriptional regulator with XRE-family HTH domain